jgi:hypothetical protein
VLAWGWIDKEVQYYTKNLLEQAPTDKSSLGLAVFLTVLSERTMGKKVAYTQCIYMATIRKTTNWQLSGMQLKEVIGLLNNR